MADSKKYDGNTWEHSLRKLTTATDTFTTLPVDLYADGNNATVGLKGNMSQTGTPTPDNPIMPQSCGERTGNEWNVTLLPNSSISSDNNWEKYDSSTVTTTMYMLCEGNTTYYLYTPSSITSGIFRVYTSISDTIPRLGNSIPVYEKTRSSSPVSLFKFTTGANDKMLIVQVITANSQTMADNAVLDKGYKIPISSGGVTTNIYLSEQLVKIGDTVDSLVSTGVVTYNIKKYVFTGDETFSEYGQSTSQADAYRFATSTAVASDISSSLSTSSICTHFTYNGNWNKIGFSVDGGKIYMTTNTAIDVTSLKQWLAEQYSAGTPVTVYYVLGTPTTETVTAPSIPTTEGANLITVDTTVQPSEFTATWTGWHNANVKKWNGSQWNE